MRKLAYSLAHDGLSFSSCAVGNRATPSIRAEAQPAAMAARRFVFVKECPLKEDCSAQAWKKASAWGWDETEARDALVRHLRFSGKHSLSELDAEVAADNAIYEEAQHKEEAPPRKKQRLPSPPGPPGYTRDQAFSSTAVMAATHGGGGFAGGGGKGSGGVYVRADILDALVDSCSRAAASARSAQRLCAAAAQSFADEAGVMEAVAVRIKTIREM